MRLYQLIIFLLIVLAGCRPDIEVFDVFPAQFCGCTDALVDYKLNRATSGTITTSPPTAGIPAVVLNTRTRATIRLCETTTISITGVNENGQETASRIATRLQTYPPYNVVLQACLLSSGWGSMIDFSRPPIANTEIQTITFLSDRTGTLMQGRVSVPVRVGLNTYTEFLGGAIEESFEFRAPLLTTESCQPSTTRQDRVRPPDFNLTLTLRCRPSAQP